MKKLSIFWTNVFSKKVVLLKNANFTFSKSTSIVFYLVKRWKFGWRRFFFSQSRKGKQNTWNADWPKICLFWFSPNWPAIDSDALYSVFSACTGSIAIRQQPTIILRRVLSRWWPIAFLSFIVVKVLFCLILMALENFWRSFLHLNKLSKFMNVSKHHIQNANCFLASTIKWRLVIKQQKKTPS